MYPLIIGIALVASLIITLILVYIIRGNSRTIEDTNRPVERGKRVLALVTEVKTGQDWKHENGYQLNAWEGGYQHSRKWQTFYGVTARWTDSQTKSNYFFEVKVWADEVARKPVAGNTASVVFDPRHPERYHVDIQSFT